MREDPGLAIVAVGLGKCYRMFDKPSDRLRQLIIRRQLGRQLWALREVSFSVRRGEALGVVGHNGAGKSTLLQILAGSLKPTTGEARLRGRVAALLELGSGFLPDFTGRENVFVNGTALGLSTRDLEQRLDEIQAFAEIGDFFDQPVKTYSSGMYVRLAFAVQACLEPDILIVDEALAVGDIFFQQKCHAHMEHLLARGVAILLVTHDVQAVRKYCSSVLLLENGCVIHHGDVEKGLRLYGNSRLAVTHEFSAAGSEESCSHEPHDPIPPEIQEPIAAWPADDAFLPLEAATVILAAQQAVQIVRIALCDQYGRPSRIFEQKSHIFFYIEAVALRDLEHVAIGLTLTSSDNLPLYCTNTLLARAGIPRRCRKGSLIRLQWKVALSMARGDYTFSVGAVEYPAIVLEKLESLSPEAFFTLATPLVSLLKVGAFTVCSPTRGVQLPYIGLVDMETEIKTQCLPVNN